MKRSGSLLLLLAVTFGLYALDLWGLGVSSLVHTAPGRLLLVASIDVVVIIFALRQTTEAGWSLAGRLALLIFGVKTAVVVVETIYLPDVLPLAWVPGLVFNGGVTALLLAVAAVWLHGNKSDAVKAVRWFPWSTVSWWRWLTIGFSWMLLFVAAGLLIFQPVATALDPVTATAYLADFTPENPMLILAFQAGRGLLWALLAWPFLNSLRGHSWRRGLVLGLLFAGLMGSAQLQAIDVLPEAIWPAHLAEVMVENLLFGFVVAWGLRPLSTQQDADNQPAFGHVP